MSDVLQRLIDAAGSQVALAEIIGVSQQAISARTRTPAPIPAEWAVKIEAALGIPRHELRPDIFGPPPAAPPGAEERAA